MKRVSKSFLCPICGKDHWCFVSDNGELAFCRRVASRITAKSGEWIHVLKPREAGVAPRRYVPPPVPVKHVVFDAARYHAGIRNAWDGVWLDGLAVSLGVNMDALERLHPGWDAFNKAVGFPMRDAEANVIGIRLRNFCGSKWAVSGSKDGLFFAPSLVLGADRELVVCEGPTDTAAAYTLDLPAVGRSSCGTGLEWLKALCSRLGARRVTIVADADTPKLLPDGTSYRPGIDGAMSLGRQIKRMFRVVTPPKKDLREWVGFGCTRHEWDNWVGNFKWRTVQ
jgi:hypothetical protein